MKTYLTYGFGIAVGGAIISMVLYFLGFNADPDKLQASRWITMVIGIVIAIVGLYLGTKEKRALTPPDKNWGYGSAFGAAFMIGLFAAIPAVIAYNAFSQRLNRLESRLGRFADGLHATFSRELEVEA